METLINRIKIDPNDIVIHNTHMYMYRVYHYIYTVVYTPVRHYGLIIISRLCRETESVGGRRIIIGPMIAAGLDDPDDPNDPTVRRTESDALLQVLLFQL